ncbi:MAG: hypothetical protein RR929_02160 [Erysipelotrichaceae bacterium]
MKNLKNKIIVAVAIVIVGALAVFGFDYFTKRAELSKGDKSIEIIVKDEVNNKEVYHETIRTNATTLDALLAETKELKVVVEEGQYGKFMTSIVDLKQDMNKGPWILYESANNQSCIDGGNFCPSINQVVLKDKDVFTFKFTKDTGF